MTPEDRQKLARYAKGISFTIAKAPNRGGGPNNRTAVRREFDEMLNSELNERDREQAAQATR